MVYRFLIVDDTEFMRKMATDILKKFDYEVAGEAVNGREAIVKYQELKPDIVLMDLTMPEMNGIDAIKQIIQLDPSAVILVCSSSNQKEMIEEALQSGAKGYLTKPFKSEYMEEVIRKYALPHVAAKEIIEVAADVAADAPSEVQLNEPIEEEKVSTAEAITAVDEPPAPHLPSLPTKHAAVSNFVTSLMCSWKEELDGSSSSYAVTCTDQENKLVIEWTGSNQQKQTIQFSVDGFNHLAGWLNQQVLVGK